MSNWGGSLNLKLRALSRLNTVVLAFNIVCALVLVRIDSLLAGHGLQFLLDASRALGFFLALPILWKLSRESLLWALGMGALVLLYSWCSVYQPALRFGVPIQDWTLAGGVSSNYSFGQFKIYVLNILLLLPGFLVELKGGQRKASPESPFLLKLLIACLLINVLIALYQGTVNLSFLGAGSGSAVSSGRAAAMLEDSGASTVYFAAMISAIVAILLYSLKTTRMLLPTTCALIFIAWGASFSGGRTFFLSLLISSTILITLKGIALSKSMPATQLIKFSGFSTGLLISAFYIMRHNMEALKPIQNLINLILTNKWDINQLFANLDQTRKIQWLTMIKAWMDHPLLGSGFGTFYSNFFQNLAWAKQWGGDAQPDVPTSLYFMLLSEGGVVGVLMIFFWAGLLYLSYQQVVNRKTSADRSSSFVFGILISLSLSFLVGTHIIFRSISVLVAMAIAQSTVNPTAFTRTLMRIAGSLIAILLTLGIITKVVTAPRPVEFFWTINNSPQVPVGYNVPIQTPYPGQWFHSDVDLVVTKEKIEIFVERAASLYPAKIEFNLFSLDDKIYSETKTLPLVDPLKPGQLVTFALSRELSNFCLQDITAKHYCSMRINITPKWLYEGVEIGFFMNTK